LSAVKRDVPQVVSDIVQKLLAKMPERRYQSAEALLADLHEAQRRWLAVETIEPFELGRVDLARELPFPDRLYGRERELSALQAPFERVRADRSEMVLLSGDSGVGKTALGEALRDTLAATGLRFVAGKADQRAANAPYAWVVEALRDLVVSVLADRPDQ